MRGKLFFLTVRQKSDKSELLWSGFNVYMCFTGTSAGEMDGTRGFVRQSVHTPERRVSPFLTRTK